MAIEYRLMSVHEIEQVFDLWVHVYPDTEREDWKREFLSIPGSREHTYLAIDDGNVLSTALLWIREMNDPAGVARRVGNVSHVATHPAARRQGHARQLLELIIEEMRQENCDSSTLFASEEARPLYEKLHWRACSLGVWEGRLITAALPRSTAYSTRSSNRLDEPYLWETLADIYTEFNQARPMVVRRDASTWQSFTAQKITDWVQNGASVWMAYPAQSPEAICGYMIAHRSDHGFLVAEMGVKEAHRAAIPNLLDQVIGSYEVGQEVGGRLYLPDEPDIRGLLEQCFNPLTRRESNELMIRPINQNMDPGELMMPHRGSSGMFWLLDQV